MARTLELDTIQFPSASNGTNITLEDGLTKFNTVNVDINGGNIDGTAIGANATSTGAFSTISGTLADGVTATTQATSDNTTKVATTAYVKAVATAEDLDIAGDTGTGAVDLDSQSLTVAGTTNEIVTVASGQTITVSLPATINAATTGNAATATAATNITVAAESTDTTCFPVFTTAATGNQAPKSGSNLTFDSADGILGATTFSGSGASLTALNGTSISTGTVAAARVATLNQNTTGSAATLTTTRAFSLTGDVTAAAVNFDGSAAVELTTSIANDSVDLGTHTTGNYIATIAAGQVSSTDGVTVTGSGSEGAAVTIKHADTSSASSSNNSGQTFIQDITLDTYGHITAIGTGTATDTNTTYSAGTDLDLVGTTFKLESDISSTVNSVNLFKYGTSTLQISDTETGAGTGESTTNTSIFIGSGGAGNAMTQASDNVVIGHNAYSLGGGSSSQKNVFIGRDAGSGTWPTNSNDSNYNVVIGANAGTSNNGYDSCVIIGHDAGDRSSGSYSNVIVIGNTADASSASATNEITLGNGSISNLRCNDTSISSLSDKRDKKEIKPLSAGLSLIKELSPVTFKWDRREWYSEYNDEPEDQFAPKAVSKIKTHGTELYPDGADGSKMSDIKNADNPNGGIHVGMIAQEVDSVLGKHPEFKDSGIVTKEDPLVWEFAPQKLIYPLINAVKELSTQVEELTAKVAALEG